MRLCSIASGSSGNCIYIGSEEHHILIDAGISGKRVEAGLNNLELTGKDLDGILLTHEHPTTLRVWAFCPANTAYRFTPRRAPRRP